MLEKEVEFDFVDFKFTSDAYYELKKEDNEYYAFDEGNNNDFDTSDFKELFKQLKEYPNY